MVGFPGLCKLLKIWSGRPGSNRRRPAWEAGILPLNYSRSGLFATTCMKPTALPLSLASLSRLPNPPKSTWLDRKTPSITGCEAATAPVQCRSGFPNTLNIAKRSSATCISIPSPWISARRMLVINAKRQAKLAGLPQARKLVCKLAECRVQGAKPVSRLNPSRISRANSCAQPLSAGSRNAGPRDGATRQC